MLIYKILEEFGMRRKLSLNTWKKVEFKNPNCCRNIVSKTTSRFFGSSRTTNKTKKERKCQPTYAALFIINAWSN